MLALHDAGALAGRRVLVLGDDDLVSVAHAAFAARHGAAAGPAALTVVEVDPALVGYLRDRLAGAPFPVEVVEHDLRSPLPDRLLAAADTVQTDPPYTVAGAELFLTRAVEALRPGAGADVFLSLGVRRPEETVRLLELLARLGLAVRSMSPGFNEYVGAGVLGGTSALWHLVTAAAAAGPRPRSSTREPAEEPPVRLRRVRHRADRRRGPALADRRRAQGGRLPVLRRPHVPAAVRRPGAGEPRVPAEVTVRPATAADLDAAGGVRDRDRPDLVRRRGGDRPGAAPAAGLRLARQAGRDRARRGPRTAPSSAGSGCPAGPTR